MLATRYREAIEEAFEHWLHPQSSRVGIKSLSLMSEDELEMHLVGQHTIAALGQ